MGGRQHPGTAVAGDEPGDDGCHETRAVHVLGRDRREEGDGEGHHRVHGGVGDVGAHPQARLANEPAHPQGHEDRQGETAQDASDTHSAGGGRGDGGGQDHQCGGVVEQSLPLQDGDDALGDSQPAGDGDGHGVGGAEDRPHGDGPGQGEPRNQEGEDRADHRGGQGHQQDGQHRHRGELAAEVDGGDAHRGGEQQRGEDTLQDHLGVQLDRRDEGQDAHRRASGQEDQRRGDADAVTELRCRRNGQSAQYSDDEEVHGPRVSKALPP